MAASVFAEPSFGPEVVVSPVVPPVQAYALDDNSAEKALSKPTEDMQSQPQIRNRHQQGQFESTSSNHEARSREPEVTLNSGVQDNKKHPGGRPAAWRLFRGRIPEPLSPPTTPAETTGPDRGYNNFKYENLEDYTKGIPRFAALHDSNDTFSVHRRFGPYAARVLLHRELELNELAGRLDALDKEDETNTERRYRLQSIEHKKGWDSTQKDIIDLLEEKLSKYYDLLLKCVEVRTLEVPTPRQIRSVYDWMVDNRPLEEREGGYILRVDDLMLARRSSERRSLQGNRIEDFVESCISHSPSSWFANRFKTEDERRKTNNPRIHHFSNDRLAICANAITVFLAVGGLLVPVFLLFLVEMHRGVMASLALGFVLAFSVTMSVVTGARVQDVLVGTAAYGAVVIMFLGNLNQGPGAK